MDQEIQSKVRKSPVEIVHALMEALNSDQKPVDRLAKEIGSSWNTTYTYLELIAYIQKCPKVIRDQPTKQVETWKREWGRLPS